jgi:hypothetical protein
MLYRAAYLDTAGIAKMLLDPAAPPDHNGANNGDLEAATCGRAERPGLRSGHGDGCDPDEAESYGDKTGPGT